MYNRESKRPRITRRAGDRDENRYSRTQHPDTREGNERERRFTRERVEYSTREERENVDHAERPERRRTRIRDLREERERGFEASGSRERAPRRRPLLRREDDPRERRSYAAERDVRQEREYPVNRERGFREDREGYERRRPFQGERRPYVRPEQPKSRLMAPQTPEAKVKKKKKNEEEETELRLNRYIAKGGVCSRRDADALILAGRVKVNGVVVQQVGVKVQNTDKVEVDDKEIMPERKVYIILNKPKDYVTTMDDPLERKTVMSLIEGACEERVYPIGRLDRQTTGVLLFTNDGDLAKKLTHPKYNKKKIYHVFLDKVIQPGDVEKIAKGVNLEDGFIKADDIQVNAEDKKQVGIEIHSGKNRIVRRIFEHLGYQIVRLDRVYFAGITKKNLPRGKWRFLTQEEVDVLKFY